MEVARRTPLGMDLASTGCQMGGECLRLCEGIQPCLRTGIFEKPARTELDVFDELEPLAMASIPNHNGSVFQSLRLFSSSTLFRSRARQGPVATPK